MNTKYIDLIEQTFDFPQEEFTTENNKLFWHGINLMELTQKYGAPLKFKCFGGPIWNPIKIYLFA